MEHGASEDRGDLRGRVLSSAAMSALLRLLRVNERPPPCGPRACEYSLVEW